MRRLKKYHTNYLILLLLWAIGLGAIGQSQNMFTQYMFNGLAINPAYAGSHETLSLTFHNRSQWTQYPGAPTTQTYSAHAPIRNDRVALGMMVMHSEIGLASFTTFTPSYAFRITLPDHQIMSLGLQTQISQFKNNLTEIDLEDPNDRAFAADIDKWVFNFGFGAYYYTDHLYVGVAMPLILESDLGNGNTQNDKAEINYLYAITAGYIFPISKTVAFKPSVLISGEEGYHKIDLNASVYLYDLIGLGSSYRWGKNISFLVELIINPSFRIGYSYDYDIGVLQNTTSGGSHEIMLNYRLNWDKGRVVNPRYF
ncbi:MAG: type IX secretion system membrane protein PorP/SprF [Bacteroidales bacterium]|jgi:type IX secretion system PorP/SprF family membrane protein|nr:type IX secretion system membrane protein PorP/SprF [Bacteroidales bacterium]